MDASKLLGVLTVAGAVAIGGVAVAQTGDTAHYPNAAGWAFASDEEGWTADTGYCTLLGSSELDDPAAGICTTSNARRADGSIWTVMESLANAAGTLEGQGTWTSPDFALADDPELANDAEITSATLSYDRLLEVTGEVEKGSTARTDVFLVDLGTTPADTSDDKTTLIHREELVRGNEADGDGATADQEGWIARGVAVAPAQLVPGNSYRLKYTTFLTTEDAQLFGSVGVGYDNVRLSTTEPIEGPQGDTGAQGDAGADGRDGTDGATGAAGTDGKDGATGQPGPAGTAGATGAPGPAGPAGQGAVLGVTVNSEAARRLLEIDRLLPMDRRGTYKNQLRVRVLCKRGADKRCEGTVKLRTARKINIAFQPGRRLMRKVTLGTASYRLNIGQIGYAKINTTPGARKYITKRGPLKVHVLMTALDEERRQQTLLRTLRLRAAAR